MKIWITEIGEPLPIEPDVRLHRYGNLSRALAKLGHSVVWWTSTFSHAKKQFVRLSDTEECVEGVSLKILQGPSYNRNVSLARIRHHKHFAKRFYQEAVKSDKPDVIITPIPTIDVAHAAVKFGLEREVPVLLDIRDLWPDEIVDLAPVPLRGVARLMLHKSYRDLAFVCRNASGIIGVSQSYLNYGLQYSDRDRRSTDVVMPIGYDVSQFDPIKKKAAHEWWVSRGVVPQTFKLCFFGTIGRYFDLATVIKAVVVLETQIPLQVILCGDGSSLAEFRKLAENVDSVFFPGWVDNYQIASLMEMSNAGLAPYSVQSRMSLPNKPFEYFAGSLPIISSIQGELKTILERYECGFTYQADSVEALVDHIRWIYENPSDAKEMGKRGRDLLEKEYTTTSIANRLSKHLDNIIHLSRQTTPAHSS